MEQAMQSNINFRKPATTHFEVLESRRLLSGAVSASLQGPDLLIRGDSADNQIRISGAGAGQVRIAGLDNTTVNGKPFVIMSQGSEDFIIRMQQGGDDKVSIQGPLNITGGLDARLSGGGALFVEGSVGPVNIGGDVNARTGTDGSVNILNEVQVHGKTSINSGGDVTAFSAVATQPTFAASNFSNSLNINNPYFPVVPGSKRVYESRVVDEVTGEVINQKTVVEVGTETRTITGVPVRVVRDRVYENGLLIEDTRDFHAQDNKGNVWYFGEDVTNIEYDDAGNEIARNHHGSWIAGVDNAVAGIVMEAKPRVGHRYFQEFAPGNVLDHGEGLATNETATVPVGTYTNVFRTEEATVVEPFSLAEKLYAPGIGTIVEFELDLEDREVIETIRLTSATLNGQRVKMLVPTTGFQGTNVGGRLIGAIKFDNQVNVTSAGPAVFNGTSIASRLRANSDEQLILIDSVLSSGASFTSGNTVSLNHVDAEGILRVGGDTDLLIFNSEVDRVIASLGSGDNDVLVKDSEFDIFQADGGLGHNTFDDQRHNEFGTLDLKRFVRV
jgi:hypothetical protein